jgi:hypothetical protein
LIKPLPELAISYRSSRKEGLSKRLPLEGVVEMDETHIGGVTKEAAKGRSTIQNTAVACAVEKAVRDAGG